MFASKVTREVTLPSDPAVTVTIGKLSWLQRRDAATASQRASMKALAEMGGMAALNSLSDPNAPKAEPAAPVAADPFLLHDTLTVLVCGVKAWTADAPINKDTLSDLLEEDAEYLARNILADSMPKATLEADRKNVD